MVAGISLFLEHYDYIHRHFSHSNCLSMNFKNQFSVICHRPHIESRLRGMGVWVCGCVGGCRYCNLDLH